MSTTAIGSNSSPKSLTSPTAAAGGYNLKPADFIKMMVTQLQNQDPLEPQKSDALLAQMSQIGQLQSSTDLSTSLKSMMTQSQIGAAGNLIGKSVKGTNEAGDPVDGIVDSVRVASENV